MCKHVEKPLVFPLSNPTSQAEITAENAYKYSKGKCIFAGGTALFHASLATISVTSGSCSANCIANVNAAAAAASASPAAADADELSLAAAPLTACPHRIVSSATNLFWCAWHVFKASRGGDLT